MIHSLTGWVHTLAALSAMLTGLFIFTFPKASALHRGLGYIYSCAMMVLIVTAFMIYRLTGSFNLLHLFAIMASVPLAVGLSAAITRRPAGRWVRPHYYWMSWSYIGLIAAFIAEISTRLIMPFAVAHGLRSMGLFWTIVGLATSVVTGIGAGLVKRNVRLVAAFQKPVALPSAP